MSSRCCLSPSILHLGLSLTKTKSIEALIGELLLHWRPICYVLDSPFDRRRGFWLRGWWLGFHYWFLLWELLGRWRLGLRDRLNGKYLSHFFLIKVIRRRFTIGPRTLSIISPCSHSQEFFIFGELLSQIIGIDLQVISRILILFLICFFVLLYLFNALVDIYFAIYYQRF